MKVKEKLNVLKSVLELEVKRGHLKWSVAELARKSGINRPLIYYHFGNTKDEIVKYAIEIMGEEFFYLSSGKDIFQQNGDLEKAIKKTRNKLQKNSYVLTFYFYWRYSHSPIKYYLEEMELRFQKRLHRLLPQYSRKEIIAIHSLLFGIVTSPFIKGGESMDKAIAVIEQELASIKSKI